MSESEAGEALQLQSALLDSVLDSIYHHDLNGNLLYVNKAACVISGYSREELLKMNLSQISGRETARLYMPRIKEILEKGHATFEVSRLCKDGRLIPLEIHASLFTNNNKKTIISVGHDISEHKREIQLSRLKWDKLTRILDSMKDGVCIIKNDFNISYVNPTMRALYGTPDGKKCYQYFDGRESVCSPCNNVDVFQGKTVQKERFWSRQGRTYEVTDAPLLEPDCSISKLSVFHDITERKKIEQLKDEFIAMVSHEIKTPLTVIMAALRISSIESLSRAEIKELLSDATEATDSLTRIVENLLELSRSQASRLVLQPRQADIGLIANQVADELRKKSSIHQVSVNCAEGLPTIVADPVRVERIFYNLVDNAIKYSPKGGEVKVSAYIENGELVVCVSDEGPGISADNQRKLFQSFERLTNENIYGTKGVGLGLKVCRILVEAHGGRIWLDSRENKGTSLYFALPLSKRAAG